MLCSMILERIVNVREGLACRCAGRGYESRNTLLIKTEDKGWVFGAGWHILLLLFHPPPLRYTIRL